jgi:hypothetical protein
MNERKKVYHHRQAPIHINKISISTKDHRNKIEQDKNLAICEYQITQTQTNKGEKIAS